MTAAGEHILDDFECLPDPEKREVPEVGDDELVAAADAVFLEYERMERDN